MTRQITIELFDVDGLLVEKAFYVQPKAAANLAAEYVRNMVAEGYEGSISFYCSPCAQTWRLSPTGSGG